MVDKWKQDGSLTMVHARSPLEFGSKRWTSTNQANIKYVQLSRYSTWKEEVVDVTIVCNDLEHVKILESILKQTGICVYENNRIFPHTVFAYPLSLKGHRICFKILNDFIIPNNFIGELMWAEMLTLQYTTCITCSQLAVVCLPQKQTMCLACWFKENHCRFCLKYTCDRQVCLKCNQKINEKTKCISYSCGIANCEKKPYLPLVQPTLCLTHYTSNFVNSCFRAFRSTERKLQVCARCSDIGPDSLFVQAFVQTKQTHLKFCQGCCCLHYNKQLKKYLMQDILKVIGNYLFDMSVEKMHSELYTEEFMIH